MSTATTPAGRRVRALTPVQVTALLDNLTPGMQRGMLLYVLGAAPDVFAAAVADEIAHPYPTGTAA